MGFTPEEVSDADSYAGAAVTKNNWRICQIKDGFFFYQRQVGYALPELGGGRAVSRT